MWYGSRLEIERAKAACWARCKNRALQATETCLVIIPALSVLSGALSCRCGSGAKYGMYDLEQIDSIAELGDVTSSMPYKPVKLVVPTHSDARRRHCDVRTSICATADHPQCLAHSCALESFQPLNVS